MNNIEPTSITRDPNMTDDVIRFYEAQVAQDEADGSRSPYLSTFTINEAWDSWGPWWPFPRFTNQVDSFWSVSMLADRTTSRTTTRVWDWFKRVGGYRAQKSWRHVIEWDVVVWWNLNGIRWLRLMWFNHNELPWTKTTQSPLVITNYPFTVFSEESNYRVCVYLTIGQYFIMQLFINSYSPRYVNINGRVKVLCIEDRYTIWMTL